MQFLLVSDFFNAKGKQKFPYDGIKSLQSSLSFIFKLNPHHEYFIFVLTYERFSVIICSVSFTNKVHFKLQILG